MSKANYTKEDILHQLVHETSAKLKRFASKFDKLTITGEVGDVFRALDIISQLRGKVEDYTDDPQAYYEKHGVTPRADTDNKA
jgi:hypothetical protein